MLYTNTPPPRSGNTHDLGPGAHRAEVAPAGEIHGHSVHEPDRATGCHDPLPPSGDFEPKHRFYLVYGFAQARAEYLKNTSHEERVEHPFAFINVFNNAFDMCHRLRTGGLSWTLERIKAGLTVREDDFDEMLQFFPNELRSDKAFCATMAESLTSWSQFMKDNADKLDMLGDIEKRLARAAASGESSVKKPTPTVTFIQKNLFLEFFEADDFSASDRDRTEWILLEILKNRKSDGDTRSLELSYPLVKVFERAFLRRLCKLGLEWAETRPEISETRMVSTEPGTSRKLIDMASLKANRRFEKECDSFTDICYPITYSEFRHYARLAQEDKAKKIKIVF